MTAFGRLTFFELKVFLRDPEASIFGIALPVGIMAIFGAIADPGSDDDPVMLYFPPMGLSVGLAALAYSLMPIALATYREKGILRRMMTTPVHPAHLLGAQAVVNALISLTATLLVVVLGNVVFGFDLPRAVPAFLLALVLALLALISMGLFIASVSRNTRVVTGLSAVVFFGSIFAGGVFMPKEILPPVLARISDFTPLGAALQALRDAWSGSWPQLTHLAVLAGCAVVFGLLSAKLFRWE